MRSARPAILASLLILAPSARGLDLVPLPPQPEGVPWPTGAWPERAPGPEVDTARLERAISDLFAESAPGETRALLVVHRGAIVAERYAPGFDRAMPFHSWSMAKSVTQALVGILVRRGQLDLDARPDVPEWEGDGDPRGVLTLRNLLHMNTGLDNADDFRNLMSSRLVDMMYGSEVGDMAGFAARAPLVHEPGTHWAYSTGTSMILARTLGRAIGGDPAAVLAFMHRELFDPLGMSSVVPEFDASGSFMGGGFVHATARDWARFGLLYLRDGVWDGRRILPPGWVDFSRTPAPARNNRLFGAHFWLNVEAGPDQFPPLVPDGSPSLFSAQGANGQIVLIAPTHDLVVVRLGLLEGLHSALGPFLEEIIASFPPLGAQDTGAR